MESDFTPQEALAAADRAAVASWIDYPPTPWWYYPAGGAWATAMAVVAATYVVGGTVPAAAVTFAGVTGGLWWYEKAYENAVAATRRRVGTA